MGAGAGAGAEAEAEAEAGEKPSWDKLFGGHGAGACAGSCDDGAVLEEQITIVE
jgi:hypothetical protein